MKTYVLLILLIASHFFSCEDNKEKGINVLVPLAVGNTWKYARHAVPFDYRDTMNVVITDENKIIFNGKSSKMFTEIKFFNGHQWWLGWLVRNGEDGYFQIGRIMDDKQFGIDTLILNKLVYEYPAEVGDSIFVQRPIYDHYKNEIVVFDTLTYTLIAKDKKIETPAGTFKCYVYKHYRPPLATDVVYGENIYEYFVPGIGRVAQLIESYSIPGFIKHKTLLYEYSLIE